MLPPSLDNWPQMMLIVVDLPAPLTPRKANNSPLSTLKLRLRTALILPKLLLRLLIWMIGGMLVGFFVVFVYILTLRRMFKEKQKSTPKSAINYVWAGTERTTLTN